MARSDAMFSHVIDRPKLSVKAAAAAMESNESKRRLSNGGSTYGSLGGAGGPKAMAMAGGSISSQASMQHRLKGGSTSMTEQRAHGNTADLHSDLCSVERLKDLRARLEPFLKPKPAHSSSFFSPPTPPSPLPHSHEEVTVHALSVPQWGLFKRPRRSRLEPSKSHAGGSAALAKSNLPRYSADESVNLTRPSRSTHTVCVYPEADGHSCKGGTTRNGVNSRAAGTVFAPARHGSACAEGSRPVSSRETETGIWLARHRRDDTTTLANNHSIGHAVGGRAEIYEASVSASASLQAKPRSELHILEWPRIFIGLSRKEKEDDFLIFRGSKLPQRPKKRPKIVERALHYCTPGNSLCDLSQGRYDVREKKAMKKRPRGLKAMESAESDSD